MWRHWWCRIPGTGKEGETDIFLVFEDIDTGKRFALHIENKKSSEFLDGQPEGYEIRARLKMNDPAWLSYSDFETVLIAPAAYRKVRRVSRETFNRFISYDRIAHFIPDFNLDADEKPLPVRGPRIRQQQAPAEDQSIPWKVEVDWAVSVERIKRYYRLRQNLKFGRRRAFPIVDLLCVQGSATQEELMDKFTLAKDDVATILANITMAVQDKGSVRPPASGGWYTALQKPLTYIVAPGFATAWRDLSAETRDWSGSVQR